MSTVAIGTTYKFSLVANPIIGQTQIGKVTAIADYDLAKMASVSDLAQLHNNLWSYLPSTTSKDPKAITYYIIKVSQNDTIVLSPAWFASAPEVITSIQKVYTFEFDTTQRVADFESVIAQYGFTPLSVS